MTAGKPLSPGEATMIKLLHATHNGRISQREIAKQVSSSGHSVCQTSVSNVLSGKNTGKRVIRRKRPSRLTERDTRLIYKLIRQHGRYGISARVMTIAINKSRDLADQITHSTTWRHLRRLRKEGKLVYKKPHTGPKLTKEHKTARIEYAKKMLLSDVDWSRVIWIDEKLWRTHGPDGYAKKQWMLKDSPFKKITAQQGGQRFMTILAFSQDMKMPNSLTFVPPKKGVNAQMYGNFLKTKIFKNRRNPVAMVQDNARVHIAKENKDLLASKNARDLGHPAYSPDLNLAEDAWAFMSRQVYGRNHTYSSLNDLKQAVSKAFEAFKANAALHKSLIDSLPSRFERVVQHNGDR